MFNAYHRGLLFFCQIKKLSSFLSKDESNEIAFVVPPRFAASSRKQPLQVRQETCLYSVAVTGEPVAAYRTKPGRCATPRPCSTGKRRIPFQLPGLSATVFSVYSSLQCLCGIELLNLCLIIILICRNVNTFFQKI